ncbi:hypothetical protein H4Q26_006280 [Puccinia striiformis f. sp. tritici PST-130]|nr:hypothetical protein H4Q26_006280 [Puccinia striiformis f. sp. tritici PST-130]
MPRNAKLGGKYSCGKDASAPATVLRWDEPQDVLANTEAAKTVGKMNPPRRPHLHGPVNFPSSRHYSVVEIYPAPPCLGLEPTSSADTSTAQPGSSEEPDLAHDKVENWTSRVHADQPFQPDFTLFEPIEPISETQLRSKISNPG